MKIKELHHIPIDKMLYQCAEDKDEDIIAKEVVSSEQPQYDKFLGFYHDYYFNTIKSAKNSISRNQSLNYGLLLLYKKTDDLGFSSYFSMAMLGVTRENLEKFKKAIQLSSLEEFLAFHKNDENLPLGNNGILISGGQKQRISIARELYKNPQLLIMDEATSALDSETEMIIKDNIDSLKGKFTMVIIAHRLSTIKDVDVIYLLDQGKIIASGNYAELYQNSERFRKMAMMQDMNR